MLFIFLLLFFSSLENYVQAVEEFQACLNLQEQYLEAHDRLLAETHYQLGLAYGYNSQYDEAVAQFGRSIEVIEKRMGEWASAVFTMILIHPVIDKIKVNIFVVIYWSLQPL